MGITQHKWKLLLFFLFLFNSVFPQELESERLIVVRNQEDGLNQEISDAVCIGFEFLYPSKKCTEIYEKDFNQSYFNADFIIVSEHLFNQKLKNRFSLVVPVYQESFTLVVKEGEQRNFHLSNKGNIIGTLNDERQINAVNQFAQLLRLSTKDYTLKLYDSAELINRFCRFDIDAVLLMSVHPNSIVRKLNTVCDGKIFSIIDELPKDFFQRNRYFYRMMVPKEAYWKINEDIETFSWRYFLAVNKKMNDDKFEILFKNFLYEIRDKRIAFPAFIEAILAFDKSQTELNERGYKFVIEEQEKHSITPQEKEILPLE